MTRTEFTCFVQAAGMGVVTTADTAGDPEAALVAMAAPQAGEVIFDSPATARKLANTAANPCVALVIGWSDDLSVRVEGAAEVLSGTDRQRYGQLHTERFPGSRALQEQFAIVRVTPRWLRYYGARPHSSCVSEGGLSTRFLGLASSSA